MRQADPHVAVARDVDQRRLADRRHRRDDFGRQQESEGRGAGDEIAARPGPSLPRPGLPSASATPVWAAMTQKPTCRTCRATACLLSVAQVLGDHRPEDRVEAGLELRRAATRPAARHNRCRPPAGAKNRPRTAISTRRDPHSTASAAATGRFFRAMCPERARARAASRAAARSS